MHKGLAWDDLLHVLAVGRGRTLSAAARALGVNHSTVFRRIGAIEARLGVRLFDRRRDGYVPTAAGEAVIALAERMDGEVVALERRLAGEDLRPSGTVRLTTTDTMVATVVPACAEFQRLYPEICIELVTGNPFLNLSRRDADVALRPTMDPPEGLHGRRIGRIAFSVYGAEAYLAAAGGGGLDRAHRWIGLDDTLSHLNAFAWLAGQAPEARIAFRANSFLSMLEAAAAGMGLAVLPCYIAEPVPGLRRLCPPVEALATDLWLLVHRDIRRTARVRAFTDYLFEALSARRAELDGTRLGAAA